MFSPHSFGKNKGFFICHNLCEKCPYLGLFLSAFSRICTRRTPNTDTFYAMITKEVLFWMRWAHSLDWREGVSLKQHCVKSIHIRNFYYSVFSSIWTEFTDLQSKYPYSVQIQENVIFSCSVGFWEWKQFFIILCNPILSANVSKNGYSILSANILLSIALLTLQYPGHHHLPDLTCLYSFCVEISYIYLSNYLATFYIWKFLLSKNLHPYLSRLQNLSLGNWK